jgi:hypothetical protein
MKNFFQKKIEVVDVLSFTEFPKIKVLTRLAWDGEKIIILKGQKMGRATLKGRYLNKRNYFETGRMPEKFEYLESSQGKYFFENLCFGIQGNYVRASRPMKISLALAKYNARSNQPGKIKSSDGRTLNKSLASVMLKFKQLFRKREKFKNDRGQPSTAANLDIS